MRSRKVSRSLRARGREGCSWQPPPLVGASLLLTLGGLAWLVRSPRRWRTVAGVLLVDHLALAVAGLLPRSRLLGSNVSCLSAEAARRGEVALTFDDGPDPVVTPKVLEILRAYDAKASFFCIGQRAEAFPEIVSQIVEHGHAVENHSYRHPHTFAFFGPGRLGCEIDLAQEALTRLTGRSPLYFRAPAGFRSLLLDPLLASRGLRLASWTRRGFDTVESRPDKVLRRLVERLAPGDVLLLHDGSTIKRAIDPPVVLEALPCLLDRLAKDGLRAVPLPMSLDER